MHYCYSGKKFVPSTNIVSGDAIVGQLFDIETRILNRMKTEKQQNQIFNVALCHLT